MWQNFTMHYDTYLSHIYGKNAIKLTGKIKQDNNQVNPIVIITTRTPWKNLIPQKAHSGVFAISFCELEIPFTELRNFRNPRTFKSRKSLKDGKFVFHEFP